MSDRIDKIREAAKDISDDFISHKDGAPSRLDEEALKSLDEFTKSKKFRDIAGQDEALILLFVYILANRY